MATSCGLAGCRQPFSGFGSVRFEGAAQYDLNAAATYNRSAGQSLGWSGVIVAQAANWVERNPAVVLKPKSKVTGSFITEKTDGQAFATAVAIFQADNGLGVDGKLGSGTLRRFVQVENIPMPRPKSGGGGGSSTPPADHPPVEPEASGGALAFVKKWWMPIVGVGIAGVGAVAMFWNPTSALGEFGLFGLTKADRIRKRVRLYTKAADMLSRAEDQRAASEAMQTAARVRSGEEHSTMACQVSNRSMQRW